MAGLIVMEDLGDIKKRNFHNEMAQAGDIDVNGVLYSRMQMLTIGEILKGESFKTPGAVGRGIAQPALPIG